MSYFQRNCSIKFQVIIETNYLKIIYSFNGVKLHTICKLKIVKSTVKNTIYIISLNS